MGSIRTLPAKPAASTLADVWRLAATAGADALRVRSTRPGDYAAIRAVQREASPHVPPWSLRQLEAQIAAFPEGKMAALAEGRVCGAAAALVVEWGRYGAAHTWREITGDGLFGTHATNGDTLLRDYMPEDAESGGHAALLVWLNPLHATPQPPASIVSERRRRVA